MSERKVAHCTVRGIVYKCYVQLFNIYETTTTTSDKNSYTCMYIYFKMMIINKQNL